MATPFSEIAESLAPPSVCGSVFIDNLHIAFALRMCTTAAEIPDLPQFNVRVVATDSGESEDYVAEIETFMRGLTIAVALGGWCPEDEYAVVSTAQPKNPNLRFVP